VARAEPAAGFPHGRKCSPFGQESGDSLKQGFLIGDPSGCAGGDGVFRCLGEIEGVGADEDRASAGCGLDQVLAPQGQQAAAHEGQVGRGIVGRHFTH
jgi:hypothetical protein